MERLLASFGGTLTDKRDYYEVLDVERQQQKRTQECFQAISTPFSSRRSEELDAEEKFKEIHKHMQSCQIPKSHPTMTDSAMMASRESIWWILRRGFNINLKTFSVAISSQVSLAAGEDEVETGEARTSLFATA